MNDAAQWKKRLTEEQFRILHEKQTEPPFSGTYVNQKDDGTYHCAACGTELFSSDTKFDSGSGWPSFYDVKNNHAVILTPDASHGMNRTEVSCARCGGHLGHLFEDGYNQPTGLRYCINSLSLDFKPESKK